MTADVSQELAELPETVPAAPATQSEFEKMRAIAETVAKTDFVPKGMRGRPDAVLACMMTGKELGIGPMQALRQVYVTEDGQVGMEAELMVARIRAAGHKISASDDGQKATLTGERVDTGETMTVSFSMDDAKTAKLDNKHNWQKYPADMRWARAASRLGRRLFPDVLGGASHTPEELGVVEGEVVFEEEQPEAAAGWAIERLRTAIAPLAEAGKEGWEEDAVVKQAARSFGRAIDTLDELTLEEVKLIARSLKQHEHVEVNLDPPAKKTAAKKTEEKELPAG